MLNRYLYQGLYFNCNYDIRIVLSKIFSFEFAIQNLYNCVFLEKEKICNMLENYFMTTL